MSPFGTKLTYRDGLLLVRFRSKSGHAPVIAVVNPAASSAAACVPIRCRHGVMLLGRTRLAHRHVRCRRRTARWGGSLERISKSCGRTRRNVTWPQNGLAVSQNKTTRTLIELCSPSNRCLRSLATRIWGCAKIPLQDFLVSANIPTGLDCAGLF
jgi:hypothetical protein